MVNEEKNTYNNYRQIEMDLARLNESKSTKNNRNVNDSRFERDKRDKQYTRLISEYSNYVINTLEFKKDSRKETYDILQTILSLVIVLPIIALFIFICEGKSNVQSFIIILSAFSAFITGIIVLPQKLIDFVFNKEEDHYIIDLIKHTQDFDNNRNEN